MFGQKYKKISALSWVYIKLLVIKHFNVIQVEVEVEVEVEIKQ
jgi:hypothetical protein